MHCVQEIRRLVRLGDDDQESVGGFTILQQAEEALLESGRFACSGRAEQKAGLFGRDGGLLGGGQFISDAITS